MLKKLKILIVEDEQESADKLRDYLMVYSDSVEVVGRLMAIKSTRQWLSDHEDPDIIFLDIHLSDGLAFDIFKTVETEAYVVFLTAYQEYALRAFELNSIDYVLKPFDEGDIQKSLARYERRVVHHPKRLSERLADMAKTDEFKSRFMVRRGSKIIPVEASEVACFLKEEFVTLITFENDRYLVDYTLDQLETQLDPKVFFRMNRQCIVSYKAISSADRGSTGKLKVQLKVGVKEELIVSQKRTAQFKLWLNW